MRIKCNRCNGRATIQSSREDSDSVKILYCTCNTPECGHAFVMTVAFSHTLSPSALDLPEGFLEKLQKSNQAQQRNMFNALTPTP